jgi:hypothetical protein
MPKRVRETRQFTTAQSKNIDANPRITNYTNNYLQWPF